MLIPLPPASVSTSLARWRCPSWKFGTVSVRSSAAFSVTVTITEKPPEVVERPSGVEAYASEPSRPLDGVRRDERRAGQDDAAVEHLDLAEHLAAPHRQRHLDGHDDPLDERPLDVDHSAARAAAATRRTRACRTRVRALP